MIVCMLTWRVLLLKMFCWNFACSSSLWMHHHYLGSSHKGVVESPLRETLSFYMDSFPWRSSFACVLAMSLTLLSKCCELVLAYTYILFSITSLTQLTHSLDQSINPSLPTHVWISLRWLTHLITSYSLNTFVRTRSIFHRKSTQFLLGFARKLKKLRGVSLSLYKVRTISTCLGEVFRMSYVSIICLTQFDITRLCLPKIKDIHYVARNWHCQMDILLSLLLLQSEN
jgi:hypothetical protein